MIPATAGDALLPLARHAIAARLGVSAAHPAAPAVPDWAREPGAAFVTLHLEGRLRGCIGSLEARRPLADDVEANALAAAFRDPRFPALTARELEAVLIEVSVLSAPEPVTAATEGEAVAALRPGVDGVILEAPGHRGTYLPQVWEQIADPAAFLRSLKVKAGLPPDVWGDDLRLSRYTVTAWEEA